MWICGDVKGDPVCVCAPCLLGRKRQKATAVIPKVSFLLFLYRFHSQILSASPSASFVFAQFGITRLYRICRQTPTLFTTLFHPAEVICVSYVTSATCVRTVEPSGKQISQLAFHDEQPCWCLGLTCSCFNSNRLLDIAA